MTNDQLTIQNLRKELSTLQKKFDSKPFSVEDAEIVFINPKENTSKTPGKDFFVRDICLKQTTFNGGQPYETIIGMQLVGHSCDFVENLGLSVGDTINVYFSPKGVLKDSTKIITDPNNPGQPYPLNPENKTCFTNLNIYKIEPVNVANPPADKPAPETKQEQWKEKEKQIDAKNIPQPEGEPPIGKNEKPMLWNHETGAWQEDDLPF